MINPQIFGFQGGLIFLSLLIAPYTLVVACYFLFVSFYFCSLSFVLYSLISVPSSLFSARFFLPFAHCLLHLA